MVQVNIQEQETRYAELRQGEKEFLSSFKVRFDNQVKSNAGAGVAAISESKRALDFICKLDPKRYRSMLAKMRNNALSMEDNAYPQTLSSAFRIASGWINEDYDRGFNGIESHSAFVSENSKEKTPTTDDKKRAGLKMKRTANVIVSTIHSMYDSVIAYVIHQSTILTTHTHTRVLPFIICT